MIKSWIINISVIDTAADHKSTHTPTHPHTKSVSMIPIIVTKSVANNRLSKCRWSISNRVRQDENRKYLVASVYTGITVGWDQNLEIQQSELNKIVVKNVSWSRGDLGLVEIDFDKLLLCWCKLCSKIGNRDKKCLCCITWYTRFSLDKDFYKKQNFKMVKNSLMKKENF